MYLLRPKYTGINIPTTDKKSLYLDFKLERCFYLLLCVSGVSKFSGVIMFYFYNEKKQRCK